MILVTKFEINQKVIIEKTNTEDKIASINFVANGTHMRLSYELTKTAGFYKENELIAADNKSIDSTDQKTKY